MSDKIIDKLEELQKVCVHGVDMFSVLQVYDIIRQHEAASDIMPEKQFRKGYSCGFWDAVFAIEKYNYALSDLQELQKEIDKWSENLSQHCTPPAHWQLLERKPSEYRDTDAKP